MHKDLAPTYQRLFGHYWVFWYQKSNNYSVVESEFKTLLDLYFQSNSLEEFKVSISSIDDVSNALEVTKNIETYLKSCNIKQEINQEIKSKFKASNRKIVRHYYIKNQNIQINFDSELVEKTIHPAISHLEKKENFNTLTSFDVYLEGDNLCLFKNEELIISVPKRNYHLLQGKFFMQLLCTIYHNREIDWMATFHGSTIAYGDHSILIIGQSGKGKSTLSALLASNGFELVADDVSPMQFSNTCIYHNPSALSVKKGAFNKLQAVVDNFSNLATIDFNMSKGLLKYIPFPDPNRYYYPCKAVIMVNYEKSSETILESISIKTLLETLIPDSWLSPNPLHAKQFLEWLSTVNIYQLTYSDTDSVISELSNLFSKLKN